MEIKLLTPEEIRWLYENKMQQDFPPSELRPLKSIQGLLRQNKYRCLACQEEGSILAYAAFAMTEGGILLDYYAVDKALRGRGVGSRFLLELKDSPFLSAMNYVLVEVESLESAQTPEESLIRQRRIRFYKGCGCRATGVYSSLFGVEYRILFLPLSSQEPGNAQVKEHLEQIYRTILTPLVAGEEEYQKVCQVYFSPGTASQGVPIEQ